MKKPVQKPLAPVAPAPLAPADLRAVLGGGDIQARAFGAGKYGTGD